MNNQPRPVWLTRETVTLIEIAARTPWYGMPQVEKDALLSAVAAWDAAPADATEAISEALFNNSNDPGEPAWKDATSQSDEWVKQGYRDGEAPAVLRALGHPS